MQKNKIIKKKKFYFKKNRRKKNVKYRLENFYFLIVKITLNNIFLTFTNHKGQVLFKNSSGLIKLKGSKKKTPHALRLLINRVVKWVWKHKKIKIIKIKVKTAPENYIIKKSLLHSNLKLLRKKIKIIEYLPGTTHGYLRRKKKRRL